MTERRRVALLLGDNEVHNSKLVAGVVEHVRQQMLNWNMLLLPAPAPGQSSAQLTGFADAFIASSDDYDLAELAARGVAVVGAGLGAPQGGPAGRPPVVLADNAAVAAKAYDYLINHGATRFALFSAPGPDQRWVAEREQAFVGLVRRDGGEVAQLRSAECAALLFGGAMSQVIAWLEGLPKPVAIFAGDEVRARMLSQACAMAGYDAGSEVLIVGIDCDPLAQDLSPVPLASVMLDRLEMGRQAAQMLQRALEGRAPEPLARVAPLELAQAPHRACSQAYHPLVMRSLHYIRLNARRGIKAEQVAYHVRMSRSSLEARFKRELGRSVHDEILRFKLEAAKQMLRSGAASMPDVAVSCGFTSVQYLYTVFGRELGCTPRVWQDRVLRQAPMAQAA